MGVRAQTWRAEGTGVSRVGRSAPAMPTARAGHAGGRRRTSFYLHNRTGTLPAVPPMLTGPDSERLVLPRGVASQIDADSPKPSRGGPPQSWSEVPWRTIVGTVGVVVATYLLGYLVLSTVRIITWVAIAGFFAIVLAPLVRRVQAHVGERRAVGLISHVPLVQQAVPNGFTVRKGVNGSQIEVRSM